VKTKCTREITEKHLNVLLKAGQQRINKLAGSFVFNIVGHFIFKEFINYIIMLV